MAEQFSGKVDILNNVSEVTITLNGNSATIRAGGHDTNGTLDLCKADNHYTIRLAAQSGSAYIGGSGTDGKILIKNAIGKTPINLDAKEGNIVLKNDDGKTSIQLLGKSGYISSGGHGTDGIFDLFKADNHYTIRLASKDGFVSVGGAETNGKVLINNANGYTRASIGGDGKIRLWDSSQTERTTISDSGIRHNDSNGKLRVDIRSTNGQIYLRDSNGKARAFIGGDGKIRLWDSSQTERTTISDSGIRHNDSNGKLRVDIRSTSGQIFLRDSNGDARAFMGGDGKIRLWDSSQTERITIDSDTGDIALRNADCAEEFDIADVDQVNPGTVMAFDDEGKLRQSTKPYDRKVAGVIAGAGGCKPGIVLGRQSSKCKRLPIALMGKVYCKVDAGYASIEAGDLLTTSPTPGHVMKAEDPLKAFGAVIGKALQPLKEGKKLIPILVALQ